MNTHQKDPPYGRRLFRHQLKRNKSVLADLSEDSGTPGAQMTPESIARYGYEFFAKAALDRQDSAAWSRIQRLELHRREVTARERALEIVVKKYEDERARTREVVSDVKLSPEEKARRVKEILGIP
jgi:hypothetical protein